MPRSLSLVVLLGSLTGCGFGLAEAPMEPALDVQETEPEREPAPEIPFGCSEDAGTNVIPGENVGWSAGGLERQFFAEFPVDMDGPVGVIFTWHGVGDSSANWRASVPMDPNADPEFPFIVITPTSTQMSPINQPAGIDWDIFESAANDDNREAMLFESIIGCLDSQYEIDTRRIYTGGFSGGALVSAMLYSRYPDLIAAGVILSGAFLNDPVQKASINTGPINVSINWDPLPEGFQTPVLMSRGGPNDTYNALGIEVINFENTMQQSRTYLQDAGRLVMDCPHTLGHTFPPGLTVSDIVAFFKAHPHGSEALYAENGLPSNLSGVCDPL